MTIKILNETFTATGTSVYGDTVGTVQIDLGRGNIVTAKARHGVLGGLSVAGFIGRYRTSPKPWIAHIDGAADKLFVTFGRDDRSGRFQKQNMISWQPDLYEQIGNPKAWNPVGA